MAAGDDGDAELEYVTLEAHQEKIFNKLRETIKAIRPCESGMVFDNGLELTEAATVQVPPLSHSDGTAVPARGSKNRSSEFKVGCPFEFFCKEDCSVHHSRNLEVSLRRSGVYARCCEKSIHEEGCVGADYSHEQAVSLFLEPMTRQPFELEDATSALVFALMARWCQQWTVVEHHDNFGILKLLKHNNNGERDPVNEWGGETISKLDNKINKLNEELPKLPDGGDHDDDGDLLLSREAMMRDEMEDRKTDGIIDARTLQDALNAKEKADMKSMKKRKRSKVLMRMKNETERDKLNVESTCKEIESGMCLLLKANGLEQYKSRLKVTCTDRVRVLWLKHTPFEIGAGDV